MNFYPFQIDYYLQIARNNIGNEQELTHWWGEKGTQFPMLQKVARKYLSCNATSVASERLFSLAGHIATKKRNGLKPEKVDMLSCLAYNLKKSKKTQLKWSAQFAIY